MATRAAMSKRLEKLEAKQTGSILVSMLVEGSEGQVWLALADERQFDGDEAREMLAKATFPEGGGYTSLKDVDLDVALGRKPNPDPRHRAEMIGASSG